MPRINEMAESKFLKKEDVGEGVLMTIVGVNRYNVAMQGAPEESKWCLEFKESEKPLVLNVTNMRLLEGILGSDNTDDWMNKQIVLFNDPSIMYAGKMVGGVRVRASKRPQPAAQSKPAPRQELPCEHDEIPF